eukprot:scaffold803_cov310-Pinguiococcus_pyrenoidosus.AAC.96
MQQAVDTLAIDHLLQLAQLRVRPIAAHDQQHVRSVSVKDVLAEDPSLRRFAASMRGACRRERNSGRAVGDLLHAPPSSAGRSVPGAPSSAASSATWSSAHACDSARACDHEAGGMSLAS